MSLKRQLHDLVAQYTGLHVYRDLPHGLAWASDVANRLPKLSLDTIFDVGANVGQSAVEFLKLFPRAHIYSFEPMAATFRRLQSVLEGHARAQGFQIALGAVRGQGTMIQQSSSDLAYVAHDTAAAPDSSVPFEQVTVETLDAFCQQARIPHIGYLKIDTEGSDLEVLRGGNAMLTAHQVDMVQVEAGMNRDNQRHVPMQALKEFLEAKDYYLFGIYEQVHTWPTREPHLRRSNLVFVSSAVVRANRG